jgi:hypothetical protein
MQGALAQGQGNMGLYGIQSANQNAQTAGTNQLLGSAMSAAAFY